jgi:DNA-binding transcriptional ArsR family regulator
MSPSSADRIGRRRRRARRSRAGGLVEVAPVFAALGDETRLDLVARLCRGGPLSIARLTEGGAVTRQAVTKHLHVLAGAGLARGTRVGRDHVWEIDAGRLDHARRWLDHIEGQWDEALARLKATLEAR